MEVSEDCLDVAWLIIGCGYYDERTPLIVSLSEKGVLEWAKDHLKIDDDGRFYEYYNDKGDLVGTYHNWLLKRIKKV